MLKVMNECEREKIRKEAVMLFDANLENMSSLLNKSLDISTKVRVALYKKLILIEDKQDNISFVEFSPDIKI